MIILEESPKDAFYNLNTLYNHKQQTRRGISFTLGRSRSFRCIQLRSRAGRLLGHGTVAGMSDCRLFMNGGLWGNQIIKL